jgi:hypothetical protein
VPPVDIILEQVEMRRRACGWVVDGQPPPVNAHNG